MEYSNGISFTDKRERTAISASCSFGPVFSSSERPLKVVLTRDEVLLGQVVQYAFFNEKNLTFSLQVNRNEEMKEFILAFIDYVREVGERIGNKCNLFLIDNLEFKEKESAILSEINQILDYKGKIIIYHAPNEGVGVGRKRNL